MREKQEPNYWLVVSTNSYTGNFERELIAYSLGLLDEVQMDINFGKEYLEQFYKEENKSYNVCSNELDEFLFESYQEVDDWEQMTFYNIDTYKSIKKCWDCNAIWIQLAKPLDGIWKEIIIRRIQRFFNENILNKTENKIWIKHFGHPKDSDDNEIIKLEHFELLDKDKKIIETYV